MTRRKLEIVALTNELARLRSVIKSAEWDGINDVNASDDPGSGCPWCSAPQFPDGAHRDDCPAFTVEGQVR